MSKKERNLRKTIFFAVLAVIIILLCGWVRSTERQEVTVVFTIEYHVIRGDTLWNIAKEYKPDEISFRAYIDNIYELNPGLTPMIYPGDALVIPIWEE